MNESIHKYFRVGTIHFMSYPQVMKGEGPILETLRKILADDFFDAVELTWIKDPDIRRQARRLLDVSGVRVCYGAQPRLLSTGLNPNDLDESGRRLAEETLRDAIIEAAELGAGSMAFLSGKYDPSRKTEAFAQLLTTTRNLCRFAESYGMSVSLEVFDYDVDKKSLIGPAELAAEFAAQMADTAGNFGLIVDLSHFPLTRETSRHVITTLRPYIRHLHFGNAVTADPSAAAYGDNHPRFGFPGSANTVDDLAEYLRVLKAEGFFNPEDPLVLSMEVKPWADEDGDLVLAGTKRALNRAWALLEA